MGPQNDTVIDEDEETCPLCIEEFDLADKNFRPCPCGYQICQFCFNSLKTTYEKSTCPNCRRVYDEEKIQYNVPSAEDYKLDQLNKHKRQAAAKRKETEKREVETSSRRNLAGVRVKQQNLVYVIGLVPDLKDESGLLQTLRGKEYFGQYGDVEKIVVSKAKPGAINQGIGVYVTFATKEAAATCINSVDGSENGERTLRAQYGTTKYCSAYLRGEVCNNKSCSFLHENGEDGQNTTLQNEPLPSRPVQRPTYSTQLSNAHLPPKPPPPIASSSQPMVRESSKTGSESSRKDSTDASALPSSVSWAATNTSALKTRQASQPASRATPSPQVMNALPVSQKTEAMKQRPEPAKQPPNSTAPVATKSTSTAPAPKTLPSPNPSNPEPSAFDQLIASVNSDSFRFVFDESQYSTEELAALDRYPSQIDPYGGARRRTKMEKEAAKQAELEAEALAKMSSQPTVAPEEALDDEPVESGSLALGGEPEDNPRSTASRGAIGRPSQSSASNFANDQFTSAQLRSLTPQQRQMLAGSGIQSAPALGLPSAQSFSGTGFDLDQRNTGFSGQSHYDASHGHARQQSRFNFANDSAKTNSARYPSQQQGSSQQHFYTSGVQGPPPGLKTAGTPPISGGGMFAQGHGFTSNMGAGFGSMKDANVDIVRGRSGTNDISKREYILSLQNANLVSSPPLAPAPGLLNSLYGQYAGAYQDPGLVKQKKKGKKHRHANTSSSGGGVVDLADPSILQARLHQNNNGTGQGLFGGQNQDDLEFPPLAAPAKLAERINPLRSRLPSAQSSIDMTSRSSTPKVPPGLEQMVPLTHSHPSPAQSLNSQTQSSQQKAAVFTPSLIAPAVPTLPIGPRAATPQAKPRVDSVVDQKPTEEPVAATATHQSVSKTMPIEPDDVSLDSPVTKEVQTKNISASEDVDRMNVKPGEVNVVPARSDRIEAVTKDDAAKAVNAVLPAAVPEGQDSRAPPKAAPLAKLDIGAANASVSQTSDPESVKVQTPLLHGSVVATPSVVDSRPATPTTGLSKASETSSARPRTIRVTTNITTKPDATPASAVTEKSTVPPSVASKQRSRQPSVSSISRSRPSTPAMSEPIYSQDVSRAGSPPASSIMGSATERHKSKNKVRKERKAKAKEPGEALSEGTVTPVEPKLEEVAPIVSRQKKKKRTTDRSATDDLPDDLPSPAAEEVKEREVVRHKKHKHGHGKNVIKDDVKPEASIPPSDVDDESKITAPAAKEDLPIPVVPQMPPYTLNQLYIDSGKLPDDPEALTRLLNEHVSHTQTLLNQLIEERQLSPTSSLFNLPPLSSYRLPPDSRKGADYLDGNGYTMSSPFGEVYLSSKERKALQQGQAIRIADDRRPTDLVRRTMISPGGTVYRHLTQDEEERVLELERRQDEDVSVYGELALTDQLKLDDSDFLNIEGGLDELLRLGSRHGVSWVTTDEEEGKDELSDLDEEGVGEEDLAALAGGWQVPPTTVQPKQQQQQPANLRAMDVEALQRLVKETQLEAEQSRREVEGVEKRWGKKSRELARWREGVLREKGRE